MKMITLGRQYETEEIIEEGVNFYEMIKKGDEVMIELKQDDLELRNRVNSTFPVSFEPVHPESTQNESTQNQENIPFVFYSGGCISFSCISKNKKG